MRRQRVGSSLVEDVHAQLREEILLGTLEPGERLLVNPLSQRFKVSLSVIREALTRLAEQGLAKSTPQVGFTVTPLSEDALLDLTWVRIEVENMMIRRAVVEGDLAWESAVVASHHALAGTPARTSAGAVNPAWRVLHSQFHAAVASGCASPLMHRIRGELYDRAELYRALAVRVDTGRDAAAEHRRICEAVLDRDGELATELMTAHIQLTTDLVLRYLADTRVEPVTA
ncbi:MAG TPA: GntR family transcriptional regulator [Actinomycetes bacterium]|nr:GntR family transcriptional regulator [Actinomycetes bacterium]